MRNQAILRLALALLLAVALAACSGPAQQEFSIVAGSENTVLEPIVREYCTTENFDCKFAYEGSLDIGLALAGDAPSQFDAVWPASGVWIDLFDSGRKVRNITSIAQTPVVLGVRRTKAEELGWIGKDIAMADILTAVEDGSLRFLMTSATQSNSGASAYLSMLSASMGEGKDLTLETLADPSVRDTVTSLLAGVSRSSGSSGWLADLYLEGAGNGTAFDAMWNYEAVLKETNDKLTAAGQETLYAVYPVDGVAIADSPLGFVDRSRGEEVSAFFDGLVDFLSTPAIQQRIADTGRRLPTGGAVAAAEPEWNFDPSRIVTAIRMPEPAVIRAALDLYQETLRKPSLTALCVDFSGSMQGNGERQLDQAMQFLFTPARAREVLVQWAPGDKIIVLPFDGTVRQPIVESGDAAGQAILLSRVDREQAGGGTDMYACADRAIAGLEGTPDLEKYLPAVIIMTDGQSEGDQQGFLSRWTGSPSHIPVFGITFGAADRSQLETVAAHTSARVFDGTSDLAGAFRAARGYN